MSPLYFAQKSASQKITIPTKYERKIVAKDALGGRFGPVKWAIDACIETIMRVHVGLIFSRHLEWGADEWGKTGKTKESLVGRWRERCERSTRVLWRSDESIMTIQMSIVTQPCFPETIFTNVYRIGNNSEEKIWLNDKTDANNDNFQSTKNRSYITQVYVSHFKQNRYTYYNNNRISVCYKLNYV